MVPKPKKILIVEDDTQFRGLLEKAMTRNNFLPTSAEDALAAQKLMGVETFDLILTDIRMPKMTGIQLLHWIKANRPTPVVLMTGFSELLEAKEAAEIGARGFLAKPFKTEEFLSIVATIFPEEGKGAEKDMDAQFSKIAIDDFVSGSEMQFDIFVRIKSSNYVKIAHKGEDIPIEQIRNYKSKGLSYLHVKKDDYKKYMGLNLTLGKALTQTDRIALDKKVNFIRHSMEVMTQSLFSNEMNSEDFFYASSCADNAIQILSDDPDTVGLIADLGENSEGLYAHSVAVSMYSVLIGRKMGWKSPKTLFRLCVGGLLHDIGKKSFPKEMLQKPFLSFTDEETTLYKTHPTVGYEILSKIQSIPADVLQIVHEHHENSLGSGFPSGLEKAKIHPLAKVVSVADEFCKLIVKSADSPGIAPQDAIRSLCTLTPGIQYGEALRALSQLINPDSKGQRGKTG